MKQKLAAIKHSETNKMTHSELSSWIKIQFKLEREPDRSTITKMFREKELGKVKSIQGETNVFKLGKKSSKLVSFPELENKLFQFGWFLICESKHPVLTDDVVLQNAKKYALEMGVSNFKGSRKWLLCRCRMQSSNASCRIRRRRR